MNKAFVKEPEAGEPRCPSCGGPGPSVGQETLAAWLCDAPRTTLPKGGYFCSNPGCDVAYFDAWEATVPVDRLRAPCWPKDPEAPVCGCFGLLAETIEEEAAVNEVALIREHLARAESDDAACATKSPTGRSCVAEVRRLFIQHRPAPPVG